MKTNDLKTLTAHQDVNDLLVLFTERLSSLLGDQLVGLYLTGSLTYGDFDPESSDIDFLAVLTHALSKEQLERIEAINTLIGKSFPKWSKRLEGSYITKDMLSSVQPPKQSRPYVNGGKLWDFLYGNEWVLNLYVMYECGIALYGTDVKELFKPIAISQVRKASKKDLYDDWEPKLHDPKAFSNEDYESSHLQAYAILTMCRILYREFNDDVASKRKSSAWVKTVYAQWADLVNKAENWQHGKELDAVNETLKFIKFTISEVD
jgi:predicted nucleotidyltransferase